MANWTDKEIDVLVQSVWRRAAFDAEFRAIALSNPTAAMQKFSEKPLPKLKIRFVEQNVSKTDGPEKILVLPPMVPKSGELADADLEHVAGGVDCSTTCECTKVCCNTCEVTGTELI